MPVTTPQFGSRLISRSTLGFKIRNQTASVAVPPRCG